MKDAESVERVSSSQERGRGLASPTHVIFTGILPFILTSCSRNRCGASKSNEVGSTVAHSPGERAQEISLGFLEARAIWGPIRRLKVPQQGPRIGLVLLQTVHGGRLAQILHPRRQTSPREDGRGLLPERRAPTTRSSRISSDKRVLRPPRSPKGLDGRIPRVHCSREVGGTHSDDLKSEGLHMGGQQSSRNLCRSLPREKTAVPQKTNASTSSRPKVCILPIGCVVQDSEDREVATTSHVAHRLTSISPVVFAVERML